MEGFDVCMEPELSVPEGTSSGVGSQLQHDTGRCLQKTIMHIRTYVRSSLYSIYCTGQMQTNWHGHTTGNYTTFTETLLEMLHMYKNT